MDVLKPLVLSVGILLAGCSVNAQSIASSSSNDQGTGRIRGRVVVADTGSPIAGARVVVWGDQAPPPHETITSADGVYEVAGLPPGAYFASASRDGFLNMGYGQRQPRVMDRGSAITVEAGHTAERIDFALPRGGAILVKVTDAAGEPLAGLRVQIQRFQYGADGQRRPASVPTGDRPGLTRTDDRGEVRAFGLMPDNYIVRAEAGMPKDRAEGFAPTYYPGTVNVAEAEIVTLGTSEERVVQFAMIASRLNRISGSVVASAGGPATGTDLQLAPGDGGSGTTYGAGTVAADGTFAIAGVPRGSYLLQVRHGARPRYEEIARGNMGSIFGRVRGEFASMPIAVDGEDVTGLRIVTSRGATISGRVVFDGQAARPSPDEQRVFALPPGMAGGGWAAVGSSVYDFPPEAAVAADGSFQITGASGTVQLDITTRDWTVKSIALNGRDITDDAMDLTQGDAVSDIVITVTDTRTTLSGQVHDREGRLVRNYAVVVLPRDPLPGAATSRRIHTASPNAAGQFEITRIRPGRYVVAAVEWMENGSQFAPQVQQRLRRDARELVVNAGQSVSLDLELKTEP